MPDINNPLDNEDVDKIKDKGMDMAREHLQGGGSDEDREQQEEEPQQQQENLQERAEGEVRENVPGQNPPL